ncbi:MAG: hypothetical protein HYV63_01245 [Candidatus Schekmanbacteria bacterium]|nr:hypothetical protein [Candidatus Schekmanbacteria bacterium]
MIVKRIAILASYDWSMRHAMADFLDFVDPVVRYRGKEYKIELTRVKAVPVLCGKDLRDVADFVVDRTTHWSEYYRNWAHQAMNSGLQLANNTYTFFNYNKHTTYDIMARAMHPADRFPTTVLLPSFGPTTSDHYAHERWVAQQEALIENTKFGWDPNRKEVDFAAVEKELADHDRHTRAAARMRRDFYPPGDFLRETMEKVFGNKYPVFLKKTEGGGGSDVHKISNLEELYQKYDATGGRSFHLQEGILDFDIFIRCMAIGPLVLPMKYLPDSPLHQHYSPDKPRYDRKVISRLVNYVKFINSYHRWTYNSYESLIRNGQIHPIDFANGCPDSHFTSLHVHFPWLIVSLLKWLSFCAITDKDMRMDMEHMRYFKVLNDPNIPQIEKYEFCARASEEYFETEKFMDFCAENFSDLEERMIAFYDEKLDEIIGHAIEWSSFPLNEHDYFFRHYKEMMDTIFRPNARAYLTDAIFDDEA